jgi:hypothetical protein
MISSRRLASIGGACVLLVAAFGLSSAAQHDDKDSKDQDKRPKVSLSARPIISVSPSRVVLSAELQGGANDFEDYYCPTIEWDWGDGTRSEVTSDCEPYQAGKSTIKRRFTVEHIFRAGAYRITFRLKKRDKVMTSATTNIDVRPGVRDLEP